MASHGDPSASAAAITFTPKPPVSINVGRVPTDLYPRIDLDMPIWERAHAFQVNKTAIMNVDVDIQTQLDALGAQLNLSSIVDGSKASFMNYYQSNWMNFANLRVQSYHDSAGNIIPPAACCLPAPDETILKPVIDGPINACRPADVKFVRLGFQLDFAHLITAPVAPGDPIPITVLRSEFYMELPQTTVQVNNNNGVPRALMTWHGAADLSTLTPAQVSAEILSPCLRDSPILLSTADFNLPGIVRTSNVVIKAEIKEKILRLAFQQNCHTLFRNLCPNYTDQPFTAVEVIKQSYVDSDGNRVSSSVWAYHQRMVLAMRPFVSNRVFPVSVCNKFMDGLDPRIRRYFVDRYKDHWKIHDLDAAYQTAKLEEIYLAAIGAEEQYRTMNATAREAVGQPIGQTYATTAGAYPSQAENTLARYDSSPDISKGRRSKNHKCFGCGSPDHAWQTRGVITCPKRDDPAVQQAAKEGFKKYRDAMRRREKAKKESPAKRALSFAELDDDAKKKMAQEVFAAHGTDAASVVSSVTSPTVSSSPVDRIHRTLFCSTKLEEDEIGIIPVLSADSPACRVLPVAVTNAFPTIELPVGSHDDSSFPAIKCVVDTAAGLTTGNIRYIASVAKQYPHTLVRLYAPTDYRPVVLSGIVRSTGDDEQFATCELDCAFEFHLPFYGRDGTTISLMIATGPDVSVNCILGLPFLKGSGGVVANRSSSRCCVPPVTFRRPRHPQQTIMVLFSSSASLQRLTVLSLMFADAPHHRWRFLTGWSALDPIRSWGLAPLVQADRRGT